MSLTQYQIDKLKGLLMKTACTALAWLTQDTALQGDGYTSFKDIPVAQIKKITAQRLLESKQTIPHYYLTIDCKVDKLIALRKQLNEALASGQGGKLSVNDFLIKASALVCPCTLNERHREAMYR